MTISDSLRYWERVSVNLDDDDEWKLPAPEADFVEYWYPQPGDRVRVIGGECQMPYPPISLGVLMGACVPECRTLIGRTGVVCEDIRSIHPDHRNGADSHIIQHGHYYIVRIDSGFSIGDMEFGRSAFAANELELIDE